MAKQPLIADSKILIVEDEFFIADDLSQELIAHGVTILGPVPTIDQALSIIAGGDPHVAVLDINLRGDPVFPLAAILSARNIPYVFVTGYDADSIPAEFASIMRHEKPVRTMELIATLQSLRSVGEEARSTENSERPVADTVGPAEFGE